MDVQIYYLPQYVGRTTGDLEEPKVTPCRTIEHELKVLPSWDTLEWTIPEADVLCDKLNPDAPWEPHNVAVEHLECFDGLASLVGGYPSMEDYEVTKKCKFCGGKMHFFAQIFPDYHARITWLLGDVGIINLYHCNKHKDEFFLHLNLQDLTRSANPKYRLLSNS